MVTPEELLNAILKAFLEVETDPEKRIAQTAAHMIKAVILLLEEKVDRKEVAIHLVHFLGVKWNVIVDGKIIQIPPDSRQIDVPEVSPNVVISDDKMLFVQLSLASLIPVYFGQDVGALLDMVNLYIIGELNDDLSPWNEDYVNVFINAHLSKHNIIISRR